MSSLDDLIERNDPDPLLYEIDIRCSRRDWEGVLEVQNRCNAATERGKTLWGVAEHAAYRLALEAPGEFAATALTANIGPLALGPLPEVAASSHDWSELADHIEDGPIRGITAYECVALGDDLSTNNSLSQQQAAFEMPLRLYDWEPEYESAEYLEHSARFPAPTLTAIDARPIEKLQRENLDEPELIATWRELVSPWTSQSNGQVGVSATAGPIDAAIHNVSNNAHNLSRISLSDALRVLCWTAASGGAHGRRRGLAFGRSLTWRLLATTCGLLDDGAMPDGDELGKYIQELQWWTWGDLDHSKGWNLQLAVHDPVDELSVAISATDSLDVRALTPT